MLLVFYYPNEFCSTFSFNLIFICWQYTKLLYHFRTMYVITLRECSSAHIAPQLVFVDSHSSFIFLAMTQDKTLSSALFKFCRIRIIIAFIKRIDELHLEIEWLLLNISKNITTLKVVLCCVDVFFRYRLFSSSFDFYLVQLSCSFICA